MRNALRDQSRLQNVGLRKEMVRLAGLEPARVAPLPPQSSVSANSTISATCLHWTIVRRIRKSFCPILRMQRPPHCFRQFAIAIVIVIVDVIAIVIVIARPEEFFSRLSARAERRALPVWARNEWRAQIFHAFGVRKTRVKQVVGSKRYCERLRLRAGRVILGAFQRQGALDWQDQLESDLSTDAVRWLELVLPVGWIRHRFCPFGCPG